MRIIVIGKVNIIDSIIGQDEILLHVFINVSNALPVLAH